MMKTYILTPEMRSSKSGFFAEGTDLEYDIPMEYPLPLETIVLENGVPIHLRLLANCDVLEREKQIERKYPEKTPNDENLRKKVTLINGMLMVDETRDKTVYDFIRRAGWLKSNEKSRPVGTKVIYEEYDENAQMARELTDLERRNKAQSYIMKLKENDLRNLYGAAVAPGSAVHDVHPVKMKTFLLRLADGNPEYILNALKSEENMIRLYINKGIDLQVLDFSQVADEVLLLNSSTEKLESVANIPSAGGIESKIDRFIDLLKEDDYAEIYSLLKSVVNDKEAQLVS